MSLSLSRTRSDRGGGAHANLVEPSLTAMCRIEVLVLEPVPYREAALGWSILAVFWYSLFCLSIWWLIRRWTVSEGMEGVLRLRSFTRRVALLGPLPTGGVAFYLLLLFHGSEKVISLAGLCFLGVPFLFFVSWLINAIVTQFQINWLLHRRHRRGEPLSERGLTRRVRREVLWYRWLHGPLFRLRGARWQQVLDTVAPLPDHGGAKGSLIRCSGPSD